MRQFVTIATNAFMELVRQPIFLLLTTGSSLFIVFLAAVPCFTMGEDTKLVNDSALAVLAYVNSLATLLASRTAFDAYGEADLLGTGIYCGAVALAYVLAGFTNYFLRRPFVSDAVLLLKVVSTLRIIPAQANRT